MHTIAGCVDVIDYAIPYCDDLLNEIVTHAEWEDACITGSSVRNEAVRNNSGLFIHPFRPRSPEIIVRFGMDVLNYLDDYGKRYDVAFSGVEPFYVNRYEPGQEYKPHADAGPDSNRVISALVYLNDVPSGGETRFTIFNETVSPVKGRLIIFPSNYAYIHAALPPTDGVKYSAAFWAHP